jgi:low temperature requirement protein LtrA
MSAEAGASPAAARPAASGGRRVHWLELFFDLVMVAYIGQVAHTMHGDPTALDAVAFFALLAAAWWAWVNSTVTMNLFGAQVTARIWLAVTVAALAIGIMAAAVPEAFTDRAAAFAIANAVIRLVWAVPWLLTARRTGTPWWRPVLYSGLPAALWLVSVVVPAPWQWMLWAAAVAIEITLLGFLRGQRTWLRDALDVDHLVERVGLLVVIVFGESVLAMIADLDGHWGYAAGITAVLGFAGVSMLAWSFFSYASSAVERGLHRLQLRGSIGGLRDTVMYLPYFLVAGVVLFAAGLGTAVAEAGHALPAGAAISLAAGLCLFFLSSVAESLRYGASWRDVVLWAPSGVVLPWLLVPLATAVSGEGVVAASTALIAVQIALTETNVRRMRSRADRAAPAS